MPVSIVRDMESVTYMSPARKVVGPPPPVAAVWKASRYELVTDKDDSAKYVRAGLSASWRSVDPFETYTPIGARIFDEDVPHVAFSKLSRIWREFKYNRESRSKKTFEARGTAAAVFATRFGLLDLFQETFAAPLLPKHADQFAWLAPDTVLDKHGRMHPIDPATEGKACLERLVDLRDPRTGRKTGFQVDELVFPHELRFPSISFTPFGLLPSAFGWLEDADTWTWEKVKNLYGVRALLDPLAGLARVSIVPTREPLRFWEAPLVDFPHSPCSPESLNSHLEGVTPHAVVGEDGRLRSSWRCPSLLKAIYLMLYLDETSGGKIQECQAPDCFNYFRVGPRGPKDSMYCPPPPSKKQSQCASRVSSRTYRERQRQKKADAN